MSFPQQLYYLQYDSGLWSTTYGNGIPPEPSLCWCNLNILD